MKILEHIGDCANIAWYTEKGKPENYIYAEVLCDTVRRGADGKLETRPLPIFFFRISQHNTGPVGAFSYRPRRPPDQIPLSEALVSKLVRSHFVPARDLTTSEGPEYAGDGVIAAND